MMELKIEQYLSQLEDEIDRLKKKLSEAKLNLENCVNKGMNSIAQFGLSKYAEEITCLSREIIVLKEQQEVFNYIFDIKD